MTADPIHRNRSTYLARAVALGGLALLVVGLLVTLNYSLSGSSIWNAAPLAALIVVTIGATAIWRRLRARSRQHAALDAYADQEIARAALTPRRQSAEHQRAVLRFDGSPSAPENISAPRSLPPRRSRRSGERPISAGTVRTKEKSHAASV